MSLVTQEQKRPKGDIQTAYDNANILTELVNLPLLKQKFSVLLWFLGFWMYCAVKISDVMFSRL